METKDIKLSPKKGGNGYVSSYSVNIGSSEARDCGFVNADGTTCPVEKVLDPEHNQIIIRLKAGS